MANAEKDKKPAPEPESGKKRPPLKVVAVVAGLMLAEAAGVYLFVGMTGPRAQTASAEIEGAEHVNANESVELELVEDKFQNLQTGNVWVWDIAIALKVKQKHQAAVEELLAKRSAEIREGIGQIIRRAQHSHLREPELTTINRQITAYMNQVIEPDPASGDSRIERVLIPKCKGVQID